jgi:3-oxoacid CoA-transferase
MDKVIGSPDEVVARIPDGASVAIAGFGLAHRFPSGLMEALVRARARDLTLVCNSWGRFGQALSQLIEDRRVARLVTSFSARAGDGRSPAEEQIAEGTLAVELVPQGTLVERLRAGGAGLGGFYTPTGVGTAIAEGKEVREIDGRRHVFERALRVDYALVRAHRGDRHGNLELRGGSRHFNVSFAKAATTAIAEVDQVVEPGAIDPEHVDVPGVFVAHVVPTTASVDLDELVAANRLRRRPSDVPRTYGAKPALTRLDIAARAARLLPEGSYVNLGIGIPSQVCDFVEDRDVTLHTENGILGYGRVVTGPDIDPDHYSAGSRFVALRPGASFFDSVTSFEMVRGGRLTAVLLGAYQVDQEGNLANWSTPAMVGGGIGGAMDLAAGDNQVIVLMEHCESKADQPKLVRRCTYPLTGLACVDTVVTDLALLRRHPGADRFALEEIAPGFTTDEVVALTAMDLDVAEPVRPLLGASAG